MAHITRAMKNTVGAAAATALCLMALVPVSAYGVESAPANGDASESTGTESLTGGPSASANQSESATGSQTGVDGSSEASDQYGRTGYDAGVDTAQSTDSASPAATDASPNSAAETKSVKASAAPKSKLDQLADANRNVVADGVYGLASGVGGRLMDVSGGSSANGANVQIYHNNRTSAQRWKVSHDANGYITLTNVRSGKALDVTGAGKRNGTNIQQYTANGSAAQRWIAVPQANGFVLHSALDQNMVADVSGASNRDGANVQLYRENGSAAQRWTLDSTPYAHGTIEVYWYQHSSLGNPTANEQTEGDYLTQEFEKGTVYAKVAGAGAGATHAVQGAIKTKYAAEGGPTGWLGHPTGDAQSPKNRVAQSFEHGSIVANGANTTILKGTIADYWGSQKGAAGWLGWPKGDVQQSGERSWQEFDGGTVYLYANGGTVPSINDKWSSAGASGTLGASANNITVKTPQYFIHEYAKGVVFATSETDPSTATVMDNDIFRYWNGHGGLTGRYGEPSADAVIVGSGSGSGRYQRFRGGTIYTSTTTGTHAVHDDIAREYDKQGDANGKLGLPTSDETATVRGGVWQSFQNGTIYWHWGQGAHTVSGGFLTTYKAQGAERGDRGFPTSDEYNDRGHVRQDFEHGSYWWNGMPGGYYTHNLNWVGQPNNYFCVPASGAMVLSTAGRSTAANGTRLSVNVLAQYMKTSPYGTWDQDAAAGLNRWVGTNMFSVKLSPSYNDLRSAVLHSYETGYAPILNTYERRGGPHPNGHANATFGHAMVVDAYNTNDDGVLIADPLASFGGARKFWDHLGSFRNNYMVWSPSPKPADAPSYISAR